MRHSTRILLPVLVLAASATTGCISAIGDLFTSGVSSAPEAWVPRLEGDDGLPVDTGVPVYTRNLRVGDPVTIKTTVSLRQYPVIEDIIDDEGNITLPMIGEFRILGMSTADAERAIRKVYLDRQVYRDCTINVTSKAVQGTADAAYFITGSISKKGRYPLKNGIRLQEAIIAAGDVTDFAGDKIRITRYGITRSFSYRGIKKGTVPNPLLMNGDVIEISD